MYKIYINEYLRVFNTKTLMLTGRKKIEDVLNPEQELRHLLLLEIQSNSFPVIEGKFHSKRFLHSFFFRFRHNPEFSQGWIQEFVFTGEC